MKTKKILIFLFCLLMQIITLPLYSEINFTSFEYGIDDWQKIGDTNSVKIDDKIFYTGLYSVRLEKNNCGFERKITLNPLEVVEYNTFYKCLSKNKNIVSLFIKFFDKNNNLILENNVSGSDTSWSNLRIYTLAPPNVIYGMFGFKYQTDTTNCFANIDVCYWNSNSIFYINKPSCNIQQYLQPFWASDTIFNETVLLYSENNKLATGKLLFNPTSILSVNNFNETQTYKLNYDYIVENNVITRMINSKMPFRSDTSFDTDANSGYYLYNKSRNDYSINPQWIDVSYIHKRVWNLPFSEYKRDYLPLSIQKLKTKSKINIVAMGMSITKGFYVSGIVNTPPYLPTYIDILGNELKKIYNYDSIYIYNASLPAARINYFGYECIDKYIIPLNPDLVIIDYGMNEYGGMRMEDYKKHLLAITDKLKLYNPNIEFIFLSNMLFDPAFMPLDGSNYVKECYESFYNYQKLYKELESTGTANVDILTISDTLQKRKKPKDLTSDPKHPNDYMVRWYAQSLISALVPVMSGSVCNITNKSNNLCIDNNGSNSANTILNLNNSLISSQQEWMFYKIDSSDNYKIISENSLLALDLQDTINNLGNITQSNVKNNLSQEWQLIEQSDGYFQIVNHYYNKYLSINNQNKIICENINNESKQLWKIKYALLQPLLNISSDSITVNNFKNDSISFDITSNTKWKLTTDANWVDLIQQSGEGNAKINVKITENNQKSERSCILKITSDEISEKHFKIIQIASTDSIIEIDKAFNIIYPNYNSKELVIKCNNCNDIYNIEIYDINGKIVINDKLIENKKELKIDFNKYNSGNYILQISNSQKILTEKFVYLK